MLCYFAPVFLIDFNMTVCYMGLLCRQLFLCSVDSSTCICSYPCHDLSPLQSVALFGLLFASPCCVCPGWDLFYTPLYSCVKPSSIYIQATVEVCSPCSLPPIQESTQESLPGFGAEQWGWWRNGGRVSMHRMFMQVNKLVAVRWPSAALKKLVDGGVIAKRVQVTFTDSEQTQVSPVF